MFIALVKTTIKVSTIIICGMEGIMILSLVVVVPVPLLTLIVVFFSSTIVDGSLSVLCCE